MQENSQTIKTRLAIVLGLIVCICLGVEWVTDISNRISRYPYQSFAKALTAGTVDQEFDQIVFPRETSLFNGSYVTLLRKGDKTNYVMVLPPAFEMHDGLLVRKTKAYRYYGCGNPAIANFILKASVDLFFAVLLLSTLRLRRNRTE